METVTTSPDIEPENSPESKREIMLSYIAKQAMIRSTARTLIEANPMNTKAKIDWIDSDNRLDRLLIAFADMGFCDG